jgi:DNA-directed RNA polymerase subunit RPC12/RpoP
MPVEYQRMRCGNCGRELKEAPSTPVSERPPCPECGSTVRRAEIGISSTITVRSMLSFKARRAGRGRPFAEGKVGDDLHRKSGRWFRLERIIDRTRDWYREIVNDQRTGEVIHRIEEPLSKHIGTARRSTGEKGHGEV